MDYIACAEDAKSIRTERAMDLAYRMCLFGRPKLTERRRAKMWRYLASFLKDSLEQGATGWDTGPMLVCDYFHETFDDLYTYNQYKIENGLENRFISEMEYIARTAIDIVDDFPGGTFGMTLGDFKALYDGGLPPWWSDGWGDKDGNPVDLNEVPETTQLFI